MEVPDLAEKVQVLLDPRLKQRHDLQVQRVVLAYVVRVGFQVCVARVLQDVLGVAERLEQRDVLQTQSARVSQNSS